MKSQLVIRLSRSRTLLVAVVAGLLIALLAQLVPSGGSGQALARAHATRHPEAAVKGASRERATIAQEQYSNRAYPRNYIAYDQAIGARKAYLSIPATTNPRLWQEIGPFTPQVAASNTSTGRATTNSGRETALAVAPDCAVNHNCRVWVGAAGGGVWRTDNGLAPKPQWFPSSNGLTSNAIGSLLVDSTDPTGNTLYAGTGEPNGSSDSEAGVGLFKSSDGGRNWTLISSSVPISKDRSIAAIAVDPTNHNHLFLGTAVARHGMASVWGGRFTPPNAPTIGLYESTDGGASWGAGPVFALPSDTVDPTTATGGDYFRGGVSKIELDRTGLTASQPTRVFVSFFDYGLYRRSLADDGDTAFHQVFASAGGGSPASNQTSGSRTEFSLAPMAGGKLRIYLGDTDGNPCNANFDNCADFYRTDLGTKPGLFGQGAAGPPGPYGDWIKLSNPTPGTPGFSSYNFCGGQCSYDMPVFSPPGFPDVVYIGGQMQYGELGHQSNGRTVLRSTNAGDLFTDMTNDARSPAEGMHPDQHWMAFVPHTADLAFFASDGGLERINGTFSNHSTDCDTRGLSGADLIDCHLWLSAIPDITYSLNDGLRTLQFQSVSLNPQDPLRDLLGGTQDNGTWAYTGSNAWTEVIGGDGGQSGIDLSNPNMRIHTYFGEQGDVNFHGNNPLTWDWAFEPIFNSPESSSFYIPLVADPKVSGTIFAGAQHVWRTQDWGGNQAFLDSNCNTLTTFFGSAPGCGDWVPIGQDLSGNDPNNFVAAIARTPSDTGTMWVGTRRGSIWVTKNAADTPETNVTFYQVDDVNSPTPTLPRRFPSGIVIDPNNSNHAWISYSGYSAYSAQDPPNPVNGGGHVYEAWYDPIAHTATFTDISHNLGDMPITGIQRDDKTGDLFSSTDFGVLTLLSGSSTWQVAANGLPMGAVYGITINTSHRVLYAATHGTGVYRLYLP